MNGNNKYNSKQKNCKDCLYTRLKCFASDDTLQRCDKCERIWIESRSPNEAESKGLEYFVRMRNEGRLGELKEKMIELINQGII